MENNVRQSVQVGLSMIFGIVLVIIGSAVESDATLVSAEVFGAIFLAILFAFAYPKRNL